MTGQAGQPRDQARAIAVGAVAVMSLIAIGSYVLRSDSAPAPPPPAVEAELPPPTTPEQPSSAVIAKAEAMIRAEPGVVDMVYDPDSVVTWTIAMKGDGTSRVGRAETFCAQLVGAGIPTDHAIVRIVDAKRVVLKRDDPRAADLGTVVCATGDVFPQ